MGLHDSFKKILEGCQPKKILKLGFRLDWKGAFERGSGP